MAETIVPLVNMFRQLGIEKKFHQQILVCGAGKK
jgi:hypothetical protein